MKESNKIIGSAVAGAVVGAAAYKGASMLHDEWQKREVRRHEEEAHLREVERSRIVLRASYEKAVASFPHHPGDFFHVVRNLVGANLHDYIELDGTLGGDGMIRRTVSGKREDANNTPFTVGVGLRGREISVGCWAAKPEEVSAYPTMYDFVFRPGNQDNTMVIVTKDRRADPKGIDHEILFADTPIPEEMLAMVTAVFEDVEVVVLSGICDLIQGLEQNAPRPQPVRGLG